MKFMNAVIYDCYIQGKIGKIIGYRIYDTNSKLFVNLSIEKLRREMTKGMRVENLEVTATGVRCNQGLSNRYTKIVNGNIIGKPSLVVAAKVLNCDQWVVITEDREKLVELDTLLNSELANAYIRKNKQSYTICPFKGKLMSIVKPNNKSKSFKLGDKTIYEQLYSGILNYTNKIRSFGYIKEATFDDIIENSLLRHHKTNIENALPDERIWYCGRGEARSDNIVYGNDIYRLKGINAESCSQSNIGILKIVNFKTQPFYILNYSGSEKLHWLLDVVYIGNGVQCINNMSKTVTNPEDNICNTIIGIGILGIHVIGCMNGEGFKTKIILFNEINSLEKLTQKLGDLGISIEWLDKLAIHEILKHAKHTKYRLFKVNNDTREYVIDAIKNNINRDGILIYEADYAEPKVRTTTLYEHTIQSDKEISYGTNNTIKNAILAELDSIEFEIGEVYCDNFRGKVLEPMFCTEPIIEYSNIMWDNIRLYKRLLPKFGKYILYRLGKINRIEDSLEPSTLAIGGMSLIGPDNKLIYSNNGEVSNTKLLWYNEKDFAVTDFKGILIFNTAKLKKLAELDEKYIDANKDWIDSFNLRAKLIRLGVHLDNLGYVDSFTNKNTVSLVNYDIKGVDIRVSSMGGELRIRFNPLNPLTIGNWSDVVLRFVLSQEGLLKLSSKTLLKYIQHGDFLVSIKPDEKISRLTLDKTARIAFAGLLRMGDGPCIPRRIDYRIEDVFYRDLTSANYTEFIAELDNISFGDFVVKAWRFGSELWELCDFAYIKYTNQQIPDKLGRFRVIAFEKDIPDRDYFEWIDYYIDKIKKLPGEDRKESAVAILLLTIQIFYSDSSYVRIRNELLKRFDANNLPHSKIKN